MEKATRQSRSSAVANHVLTAISREAYKSPAIPNHVLAAIPREAYKRMVSGLIPCELSYGQILYEPLEPIQFVYFPCDCLVSLLTEVEDGRTLEVGMVGNEGMVGMPMALGIGISSVQALVQGKGTALRMSAARFRTELKRSLPLQRALFRYDHLLMAQISQTAACNRFHDVDQRLARWLLMTSDRLQANKFFLTQDFLAHMLGIRRVGVTKAASTLQRGKLIRYSRGSMEIIDRAGLEAAACVCYRIVKDLQDIAQT